MTIMEIDLKNTEDQSGTRTSASERVFSAIMQSILNGQWRIGEKIPSENKLAEEFGVSRVTVRSAIQRLASLGVLESRRGGGTFVCAPGVDSRLDEMMSYFTLSKADRLNVFEFRRTVETEAAALAAERADAETIAHLRLLARKMREAEDREKITQYDLDFHRTIAKATGNPIFIKVFDVMNWTYRALLKFNVGVIGAEGASYHDMLAGALEARDSKLARAIMLRHLDNAMRGTESGEVELMALEPNLPQFASSAV